MVGRISASVIRHSSARGYNGGLRSANPPYPPSNLLAQNRFRGVDDAHGRILPAIGAELLGVLDEHVGVDDRLVGIALVPAVHPGQHHLDGVVATLDELLAGHGREIENDGMRRRGLQHERCGKQD